MQSSQANCGSTAVYNSAQAVGKSQITLDECEKACEVSATEGTSTKKLLAGIKTVGLKLAYEIKEARDDVSILLLKEWLRRGGVAALAVDGDSHWVSCIGVSGARYLVADSDDSELVLSYSEGELLQRWQNPGAKRKYYGAIITNA